MAKKRAKKKSGKRAASRKTRKAAVPGNADKLIDSLELDTRHVAAEPLLRKMAEGKATADDVNKAIDEDSRLEPLRDVMTKIAAGERVTAKAIDEAVDSKNEPLRPFLEALNKG